MQMPRNAGGLPRLVRVPSPESAADDQSALDMREWRHGFTEESLELHAADQAALDADAILVLLPTAPVARRSGGADPVQSGEAISARYSLWLMLLLTELQRQRDMRRTGPTRAVNIPVAFAIAGADDRVGRGVQNAFARETDLFRMVLGDAGVLPLGDDRRDGLKIVKHFADRLSSPSSAMVWSLPTDTVLAHTPAIAFRRGRRRRMITRATAAVAVLGVVGIGYQWVGARFGAPGVPRSLEASAHLAVSAALDSSDVSDGIRRARLNEALVLCKRPAANCSMQEVVRVGNALRRLRTDE
jgi:hypothetical protein